MSSIEEKALALVNEVCDENGHPRWLQSDLCVPPVTMQALYRAIEAHEADKQAFSDAVGAVKDSGWSSEAVSHYLSRFILIKLLDPLVEAIADAFGRESGVGEADKLRQALAARGLGVARIGEVVEGQQQ